MLWYQGEGVPTLGATSGNARRAGGVDVHNGVMRPYVGAVDGDGDADRDGEGENALPDACGENVLSVGQSSRISDHLTLDVRLSGLSGTKEGVLLLSSVGDGSLPKLRGSEDGRRGTAGLAGP